ncbi:MAG: hypothetical protein IPP30_04390 [Flavobacterium sp.]|nr:hypothetical protein [Flavobacterium sp.]
MEYIKRPLKSLSIILLFWSVLIFTNLAFLKKDISVRNLYSSISNDIYTENFPEDLFYGNKVFVVKRKSDTVFIPSDMLSFLFKKEYKQKLLFLSLPFEIFNSKEERFIICKELLLQSIRNDMFMQFHPKQTRITLRAFKKGNFLEYYNYTYTYYFNRDGYWGLYGGIKNDSTMVDTYYSFIKQTKAIKSEKISFQSTILSDKIMIRSKTAKLQFDKISFDETPQRGMMQLNFPPQNIIYRTNYWNIIDGSEFPDLEEDFFYLQFCRDEISSKSL